MLKEVARSINTIAEFCGRRDLRKLTKKELFNHYGIEKLDVLVLFGGSVLAGGDLLAESMQNEIAQHYIIVGGYGHTSKFLFAAAEKEFPGITEDMTSEAELFQKYLKVKYDLAPDYIEVESTNCGNNITNLLALIQEENIPMKNVLMIQEAAMQLRMEATLKKYVSEDIRILNYAVTQVSVSVEKEALVYDQKIPGFWDINHYITLFMGEIPRLHDTAEGYGPRGQQFISHVEIPEEVLAAYAFLKQVFPDSVRVANPEFASKE